MTHKKPPATFFINCPFDDEYKPLFQSTIFTLIYLGFKPLFSSNTSSDRNRISSIMKLIESSDFSIHDLCRNKPTLPDEPVRFNMPLELGLAMGCRRFGGRKHQRKKLLILDRDAHEYDKYIGDISGQDIESHKEDPQILISKIRHWITRLFPNRVIPFEQQIWFQYNQFKSDLKDTLLKTANGPDSILDLEPVDFMRFTKDWISAFQKKDA